ncbi:hypothetical protein VTI74DRAFT_11671 [Chaetomium olivicolor]
MYVSAGAKDVARDGHQVASTSRAVRVGSRGHLFTASGRGARHPLHEAHCIPVSDVHVCGLVARRPGKRTRRGGSGEPLREAPPGRVVYETLQNDRHGVADNTSHFGRRDQCVQWPCLLREARLPAHQIRYTAGRFLRLKPNRSPPPFNSLAHGCPLTCDNLLVRAIWLAQRVSSRSNS